MIADPVDPKVFYAINLFKGELFTSIDGGMHFSGHSFDLPGGLPNRDMFRGDNRGGQDQIYATPGRRGNLWIAAFDGLYHSTGEGRTFRKLRGVDRISAFGFGRAADSAACPALYLVGIVDGVRGIFRSDDEGQSWVRINDDDHQWGLILRITGDPRNYGRVYVGTHGRGILYGDPSCER